MAKVEKITGNQLERVIDLCQDYNLFDFIFEEEDSLLNEKEWDVYREYSSRFKLFLEQKEKSKDDSVIFATSGQEDNVLIKLNNGVKKRSFEYKKVLLKKENRQFIKDIAKIFNEEIDLNDIKLVMDEVSGKLPFLKESFQSM